MLYGHSLCCPTDQAPHKVQSLLYVKLKTLFSFKKPHVPRACLEQRRKAGTTVPGWDLALTTLTCLVAPWTKQDPGRPGRPSGHESLMGYHPWYLAVMAVVLMGKGALTLGTVGHLPGQGCHARHSS